MTKTKVCIWCKTRKPVTDFGNYRLAKDGKTPHCKKCLRNGSGDHRFPLGPSPGIQVLLRMTDSHERYWLMQWLYWFQRDEAHRASQRTNEKWQTAAAEKRIKTRKKRGSSSVQVWIEPPKHAVIRSAET